MAAPGSQAQEGQKPKLDMHGTEEPESAVVRLKAVFFHYATKRLLYRDSEFGRFEP